MGVGVAKLFHGNENGRGETIPWIWKLRGRDYSTVMGVCGRRLFYMMRASGKIYTFCGNGSGERRDYSTVMECAGPNFHVDRSGQGETITGWWEWMGQDYYTVMVVGGVKPFHGSGIGARLFHSDRSATSLHCKGSRQTSTKIVRGLARLFHGDIQAGLHGEGCGQAFTTIITGAAMGASGVSLFHGNGCGLAESM